MFEFITRWFSPRHKRIYAARVRVEHILHNGRLFARASFGPHYEGYRYFCPRCGSALCDGPEGGCAVNLVCPECDQNFGLLPDYAARDATAEQLNS